jgi:Domain of unknown function (DUF5658)
MEAGLAESPSITERRATDRRVSRKFVMRDRRSGFDRRGRRRSTAVGDAWEASLVYLRDNASALFAVLATANLLSVLDLVFTLHALQNGAQEGNPLMRALLDWDPALAGGIKVGIIATLSLIIWRTRRYRLILQAAVFALAVYAAVILYHLYCLVSFS